MKKKLNAFFAERRSSDETIEGICLDCLEDYYTPERAIRFLADTNKEKEFYVEVYMEANCSEANSRMVDLCKAEFHKGVKFIEFQIKNLSSIDEYLLGATFEYLILRDYVLKENIDDWAFWVFAEQSKKSDNIIISPAIPIFVSCIAEKRKVGSKCQQLSSNICASN